MVIAPEAIFDAVSGSMCTRHRATARRCVGSLEVTSTIRARPSGSRWVNSDAVTAAKCRANRRRSDVGGLAQPPIWLIDAVGRTKSTWPMRCPAHFVPTAPRDRRGEVVVGAAVAQHRAEVELVEREQAGAELALGGDPHAVAVARRTAR